MLEYTDEVDYITRGIIEKYKRKYEQQQVEIGSEVDIKAEGKPTQEEKGGKLDIKA